MCCNAETLKRIEWSPALTSPIISHSKQTPYSLSMNLLPDTYNYGLHMQREWWEHFPHHWLQRKPLVNDPGMHHGTCVMHVPWCMLGSLTCGGGENVPGIPDACATRDFMYLATGPWGWVMGCISCDQSQIYFLQLSLSCTVPYWVITSL